MKPTLVFDYDGTIHNTMRVYEPAIREVCSWLLSNNYARKANPDSKRISSWLGMNAREMWSDFMPELDPLTKLSAEKIVGDYMLNLVRNQEAQWYEGTTEVLDLLKAQGYHMVILSNSKYLTGKTHFEEFDMGRWFDKWYDCESFGWAPKTEIIKSVQSDYPGELVLIGDRKSDLDAALSIGSKFIGCLYGFGSEDELEGATHLISSISELSSCFTHND